MSDRIFTHLDSADPYCEFVVRLVALSRDGSVSVQGSGLLLGAGLCITAKHVFDDFLDRFGYSSNEDMSITPLFDVFVIQVRSEDREVLIWKVDCFWASPHTDALVLHLVPHSENSRPVKQWKRPVLQLIPPVVGTRVHCVGYRLSELVSSDLKDEHTSISFKDIPTVSTGEVREVHVCRRDSVRLCFPCFRTNQRLDGGMSGGPIISESGEVCGLNCSSLPAGSCEEEDVSYFILLYAVMGVPMSFHGPGFPESGVYHVLDLARTDVINVRGVEHVRLAFGGAERFPVVHLNQ